MNINLTLSEQIEVIELYLQNNNMKQVTQNQKIWQIYAVYQIPLGDRQLMFKKLLELKKRLKNEKENWTKKKKINPTPLKRYFLNPNKYGNLRIGDVEVKNKKIIIKSTLN